MAKCYLVTDGSYSDYSVYAVFTTREAAEAYRVLHGYDNDIEEMPLDPVESALPVVPSGCHAFSVGGGFVEKLGDTGLPESREWQWNARRKDDTEPLKGDINYLQRSWMQCYATDEQHAVKIAHERRMQWLAQLPSGYSEGGEEAKTIFGGRVKTAVITKEMLFKDGLNG